MGDLNKSARPLALSHDVGHCWWVSKTTDSLGTIIANGTMLAFVLHNERGAHGIESSDRLAQVLRTESKAALASIMELGEALASMGNQMIKHTINVECNAAAARTIATMTA